ncbi:MAG: hypothetical protein ACRD0A_08350 [Acidimicrobiales bacterium]
MGAEIVVEPAALVGVAGALCGIGESTGGAAALVRSAGGGVVEASIASGVEAVASAWGGTSELLAASTGVLGELVGRAAAGYLAADAGVERGLDSVPS